MGKISHLGMENVDEARGTCWVGYQQKGMKKKGDKMVPNCVKETIEIFYFSRVHPPSINNLH